MLEGERIYKKGATPTSPTELLAYKNLNEENWKKGRQTERKENKKFRKRKRGEKVREAKRKTAKKKAN